MTPSKMQSFPILCPFLYTFHKGHIGMAVLWLSSWICRSPLEIGSSFTSDIYQPVDTPIILGI